VLFTWYDSLNASWAIFQLALIVLWTWPWMYRSARSQRSKCCGRSPRKSSSELEVVVVDVLEIPPGRHAGQVAVEAPRKAVERAAELRALAGVVLQLSAAMQTRVVVGLDRVGAGTGHDERHGGDVVDDVAADVGDLLLAAGELPDPLPQALDLTLVPLARRVAILGHVFVAEEPRRLQTQHVGHLVGVGVEQVLIGDSG
jgi:hypothetical protein